MKKRMVVSAILAVMVVASYTMGFSFGKERDDVYKELEIFSEGLAVIEKKYVEDKAPQDLVYGAMRGMLFSLDSYSQFLTPEDYRNLLIETEGQFGGLGIEITIRQGLLTIVSPIEDTPAWASGLKPGDLIIKIDGELTKDITINEAVKKLRGEPGSDVTITILREATRKVQDVTITRGIIKIKDIKRAVILDNSIGYIRIAEFRETTAKDLGKGLEDLDKQGLKALILDVRNNPGGLLNSAIDVSSRFLETGKVVVSTKSRDEAENFYKSLAFQKKYLDIPMVVLINQGSASGSEIVAAALRENNRAILLGETTFGKGSVQTIIPLSDGSALRLTTSKYYTPSGASIHEKGVNPDIEVAETAVKEEAADVFNKLQEVEFDYTKDYQIVRAIDLIKGIMVLKK
ncbi:MAG: S41 family peptidase [Candidatus Omnitrophica bacterium]|nr:S41 family peptidase [Candidatus Omnitrophota bacterium]MBU2044254.1 S41 family peptidase [Candidatus Omnitrophota bacterium]MBU2251520.1 S41 family peptidase [Candidatus Omnitrophota bacterium]MBU2266075.1 S41 family peptidase [Candidatus Omnitrophota bacterium]MBU2474069.1 S41 family peptidase [Candidatus Omnitrophota bacterium]